MKSVLRLALAAFLLATLIGCGSGNTAPTGKGQVGKPVEQKKTEGEDPGY